MVAWQVDATTFKSILMSKSKADAHDYASFIKEVPLLKPLSKGLTLTLTLTLPLTRCRCSSRSARRWVRVRLGLGLGLALTLTLTLTLTLP